MWPLTEKPDTPNLKLEMMGLAAPGKTRRLTGTGPGMARQDAVGRVFVRICTWTKLIFRSQPGPLAVIAAPVLNTTLNAQRRNGRSPADSNHEPQYSSKAAGWIRATKLRGAERSTAARTPASHF